jgi:RNA polymerase sigma factor (sigma-70 family)
MAENTSSSPPGCDIQNQADGEHSVPISETSKNGSAPAGPLSNGWLTGKTGGSADVSKVTDDLRKLMDDLRPWLWAFALRLCGHDCHLADDALQELELEVTKRGPAYIVDAKDPTRLLFVILRGKCVDTLRRYCSNDTVRSKPVEDFPVEDPGLPPPDQLIQKEEQLRLLQALAALDASQPDNAEVIRLYDFEGLSMKQVARALKITPNCGFKRRATGLEILGTILGDKRNDKRTDKRTDKRKGGK